MRKVILIVFILFILVALARLSNAEFGEGAFGSFFEFLSSGRVAFTSNQNGSGFDAGITIDGTAGKTGTCASTTTLTVVSGLITACS